MPREITAAFLRLIDADNARGQHLFALRRTGGCWDGAFAEAIVDKLAEAGLKCGIFAEPMDEATTSSAAAWR